MFIYETPCRGRIQRVSSQTWIHTQTHTHTHTRVVIVYTYSVYTGMTVCIHCTRRTCVQFLFTPDCITLYQEGGPPADNYIKPSLGREKIGQWPRGLPYVMKGEAEEEEETGFLFKSSIGDGPCGQDKHGLQDIRLLFITTAGFYFISYITHTHRHKHTHTRRSTSYRDFTSLLADKFILDIAESLFCNDCRVAFFARICANRFCAAVQRINPLVPRGVQKIKNPQASSWLLLD